MWNLIAVAALLLCLSVPKAEASQTRIGTAESLRSALEAAAPGDRLVLEPGRYGTLILRHRRFSPAIEIAAASPGAAQFSSIQLVDVEGVRFSGLAVAFGPTLTPLTSNAVDIRESAHILLDNLSISSATNGVPGDDAYGVIIRGGENVAIRASRINDVFRGVAVLDSTNVEIRRTVFRAIGSDGVVARGAIGLKIVDNYFADFATVDPARFHPDAIQLWSRLAQRANEDVVIRGNLIRRGNGDPAQGVFIKSLEIPTIGVLIEENVIEQSMGQGIAVQGAESVVIQNNTVIPFDAEHDRPGIDVRAPIFRASVTNNIMIASRLAPGVEVAANDAAGFHNKDVAGFVAARMAGGLVRLRSADYAPTGAAGAREFVHDLWHGDVPDNFGASP